VADVGDTDPVALRGARGVEAQAGGQGGGDDGIALVLFDTNTFIDMLNGVPEATAELAATIIPPPASSTVRGNNLLVGPKVYLHPQGADGTNVTITRP
jgi:hypothetical protein